MKQKNSPFIKKKQPLVIELYTKDFERLNKDDLNGEFASIGAKILEASDSIFKDFWLYNFDCF